MNEYTKLFLEGFNEYDPFDAWCESTVMGIYARMNGDAYIAEESFSEKVKNGFDKVCETISNWIGKVKEFLKSVKKWIVEHAKAVWAKLGGKKEVKNVSDPKAVEDAANKLSEAGKIVQMAAQKPDVQHKAEETIKAASAALKTVVSKRETKEIDANEAAHRVDVTSKALEQARDTVNEVRALTRKNNANWIRGKASVLVKQAAGFVKTCGADIKKIFGNADKAISDDYDELMGFGDEATDIEGVPI